LLPQNKNITYPRTFFYGEKENQTEKVYLAKYVRLSSQPTKIKFE